MMMMMMMKKKMMMMMMMIMMMMMMPCTGDILLHIPNQRWYFDRFGAQESPATTDGFKATGMASG